MKSVSFFALLFISSSIFFSCNNDSTVGTEPASPFSGSWSVDRVQLVSAPASGESSELKQLFMSYGDMDARNLGKLDISFGADKFIEYSQNLPREYGFHPKFIGSTGFAPFRNLLYISADGGRNWNLNYFPGGEFDAREFFPIDENILYTLYGGQWPYKAKLYKTGNRGQSWFAVNDTMPVFLAAQNSNYHNGDIFFLNESTGFVMEENYTGYTKIFKTTNGGKAWVPVFNKKVTYIKITFQDEMNGRGFNYLKSNNTFEFVTTSDGGVSWISHPFTNETFHQSEYYFINRDIGWASGHLDIQYNMPSVLFKTIDGGKTWNKISDRNIYNMIFINENTGFTSAFKTTDGGYTWSQYHYSNGNVMNPVLINNSIGLFTYDNKLLIRTDEADNSAWFASGNITNPLLKQIAGTNNIEIYAYGKFRTSFDRIVFNPELYSSGIREPLEGTFNFERGNLFLTFTLPENEVWKIKLKRN